MTQRAGNYGRVLYQMGITGEMLDETKQVLSQNPQLAEVLGSPQIATPIKHRLIQRIFKREMQSFLKVLCDHGSMEIWEDICKAYQEYDREQRHILSVKMVCAAEPTEEQKEEIEDYLKKKYRAEELQIEMKINPELLGGFQLLVGDVEEDWSIRGRLHDLEQRLTWR